MDDPVDEQGEADHGQHEADEVQPARVRIARLRHDPPDPDETDDDDRDVDQEDRAPVVAGDPAEPAGVLQQQPTQHRAERDGRSHSPRPRPDGLASLMRREDDRDDGKSGRQDGRTAHAHDGSEADEHPGRRGEGARRRGQREDDEPDHQDPLAAVAVPERAPGEEQCREGEDVAVHGPHELPRRCPEVLLDRGQRDVEHRVVEYDDEQAHDEHTEDRPPPGMAFAVGHPRVLGHGPPRCRARGPPERAFMLTTGVPQGGCGARVPP